MRLIKYLSYSNTDEYINKFRSMFIGLSKPNDEINSIVENIYKQYEIEHIEPVLEKLNKELKKIYTGKYRFCLCYEKEKKITDFCNNKRKNNSLTLSLFEANSSLSKIKTDLEKKIKEDQ
jgi:hypothetical protein